MTKLNLNYAHNMLLMEDEVKKASFAKQPAPKQKSGTVKAPKDITSGKMVADKVKDHKPTESGSKSNMFNDADFASNITKKMDRGIESKSGSDTIVKPKVQQKTRISSVDQKPMKKPAAASENSKDVSSYMPDADMFDSWHSAPGTPDTISAKDKIVTPKVATATAANGRAARIGGTSTGKKISEKPSDTGFVPSDAGKPPAFQTETRVAIMMNGKKKLSFDLISGKVLNRLVREYRDHGMQVEIVRENRKISWLEDATLRNSIVNAVEAKFNRVPDQRKKFMQEGFRRFETLVQDQFHPAYRDKNEFRQTVTEAYRELVEKAERAYQKKMETYHAIVRYSLGGKVRDAEIITEAKTQQDALRSVKDAFMEKVGFTAKINHVMLDGVKYPVDAIENWKPKT